MYRCRNRPQFGIHIGTSSLLLIFVVLVLVCLASLTLVGALSQRSLSERALETTGSYYDACNSVNEELSGWDARFKEVVDGGANEGAFYDSFDDEIVIIEDISDTQCLEVIITPHYPDGDSGEYYRVLSWKRVLKDGVDFSDTGDTLF
ncbi:MAG: hypothetical protein K5840_05530 [Eubacterium sp.]|nr:hypothetical protein [Eubacterium sp.]